MAFAVGRAPSIGQHAVFFLENHLTRQIDPRLLIGFGELWEKRREEGPAIEAIARGGIAYLICAQ
jgi:hypothetical protein